MPPRFSPDMLPRDVAPDDTLYVADRELRVVYANDAWSRFAAANRGERLLEPTWNDDLLANLSGSQRDRWARIYELLLAGRIPHHQERMNCSSPVERRFYRLRVTPVPDDTGEVAWLVHHSVRVHDRPETAEHVDRKLTRLEDPEELADTLRRRVATRELHVPGFDVAIHFAPLESIGGDLVWHREYASGVCDLVHADAMGHGTEAGRLAAKMVVVLDELASARRTPSRIVAGLDRAMVRIHPDEEIRFATGLFFRFERDARLVRCCSFGHEGPIFSKAGLVRVKPGFPVGLALSEAPWVETRLDLRELGERFLVFSDGITEQFNAEGEMFATRRLEAVFHRHAKAPLADLVNAVVEALTAFRGSALVKDDQTLLALEFRGTA